MCTSMNPPSLSDWLERFLIWFLFVFSLESEPVYSEDRQLADGKETLAECDKRCSGLKITVNHLPNLYDTY